MPWWDKTKSADQRARALVKAMTYVEKVSMMTRSIKHVDQGYYWGGGTAAIDRLKIPELRYSDGPQGFRTENLADAGTATAFPTLLALGMTWDRELVYA